MKLLEGIVLATSELGVECLVLHRLCEILRADAKVEQVFADPAERVSVADFLVRDDVRGLPRIVVCPFLVVDLPQPGTVGRSFTAYVVARWAVKALEPVPDMGPTTASLVKLLKRPIRANQTLDTNVVQGGLPKPVQLARRAAFGNVNYVFDAIPQGGIAASLILPVTYELALDPDLDQVINIARATTV